MHHNIWSSDRNSIYTQVDTTGPEGTNKLYEKVAQYQLSPLLILCLSFLNLWSHRNVSYDHLTEKKRTLADYVDTLRMLKVVALETLSGLSMKESGGGKFSMIVWLICLIVWLDLQGLGRIMVGKSVTETL